MMKATAKAFMKRFMFQVILLISIAFLLTSCLEVKQSININKEGSGEARLEVAIQQMWAPQVVPKLKKDMPGWNIVEEKEKDGKYVIVFGRKFKDVFELNDDEIKYTFSSERKGFLKKAYAIDIKYLKSPEMPFPYEVTIDMPGSIDETNGTKLSSGKVKWNLQGFSKGTKLTAKSSAFTMPDFTSLKESFNKVFNKLFYRESIVFLRDGNLWIMDSDGKNQKQLTKEQPESDEGYILNTFGHFDVSADGKIAYDRIRKYTEEANIYILSLKDGLIRRLTTSGDTYLPSFSPDANRIAVAKAEVDGYGSIQQGKGIWIIDVNTGMGNKIFDFILGSHINESSAIRWSDSALSWSSDGKLLALTRYYDAPYYKHVSYIVDPSTGHVIYQNDKAFINGWIKNNAIIFNNNRYWLLNPNNLRITPIEDVTRNTIDGYNFSINPDGDVIVFSKKGVRGEAIWQLNTQSGGLNQLIENASSPKWTSVPRISVISPNIAKIIILATLALTGLLLFLGMALIARKAVKVVVHKIPKRSGKVAPRGIFCPQCGKENSAGASFCTNCGRGIK